MSRKNKRTPSQRNRSTRERPAAEGGPGPRPATTARQTARRAPQPASRSNLTGMPRLRGGRWWVVAAVVVLAVGGVMVAVGSFGSAAPGSTRASPSPSAAPRTGPATVASPTPGPALAALPASVTGETIDTIACESHEQAVFHIHAHLAVYVDGIPRGVPAGIGIAPPLGTQQTTTGPYVATGSCFYWLHTHSGDGIVHIESPVRATYTLGQLFDIWQHPLDATHVGPATGAVIAYVDGKRFSGNPRDIPLNAHTLVQLDVGADVAPVGFTFPAGL